MEEQRMLVWSGQGDQRGRMRLEGSRHSQWGDKKADVDLYSTLQVVGDGLTGSQEGKGHGQMHLESKA